MGKESSSPSSSCETNEFEFGCIKPASPSPDPKRAISPADELFFNGRLLPHSFPVQSRSSTRRSSSSTGSRDSLSLVSSSRSSSTSSSSSDAAQKKIVGKERLVVNQGSNGSKKCDYGSAFLRWQIISISPAPVLGPSVSRRRRSCGEFGLKLSPKKKVKESDEDRGFCQRILRSFVKSCKACHAMEEGAAAEDNDLELK